MAACPLFPGTDADRDALLLALANWCTCTLEGRCAGHSTLVNDAVWLGRQLFARSIRERLLAEEFEAPGLLSGSPDTQGGTPNHD